MKKVISLKEYASLLEGRILYSDYRTTIDLMTPYVTRPALQFTGYFEYFDNDRIQIIGNSEDAYLKHLSKKVRRERIREVFKQDIPCVVLAHGIDEYEDYLDVAREEHVILIKSPLHTNVTINKSVTYLEEVFAPVKQIHGVIMEVLGVGILITGESGIGKSEIALDLIHRGHRLVGDDLVEIKRIGKEELIGSCPKILQYFMELRGVGIIDVKTLFGMGAVKDNVKLELMIELEKWDPVKHYERLGTEYKTEDIHGLKIDKLTIPVRPGRNMSVIIETVARNFRVNETGYNAGLAFSKKVEDFNNNHIVE